MRDLIDLESGAINMRKSTPRPRTTPRTRAEIKNSTASLLELAKTLQHQRGNRTQVETARDSPEDLSHRPHKLCTTLTPAQEAIAVAVRA